MHKYEKERGMIFCFQPFHPSIRSPRCKWAWSTNKSLAFFWLSSAQVQRRRWRCHTLSHWDINMRLDSVAAVDNSNLAVRGGNEKKELLKKSSCSSLAGTHIQWSTKRWVQKNGFHYSMDGWKAHWPKWVVVLWKCRESRRVKQSIKQQKKPKLN